MTMVLRRGILISAVCIVFAPVWSVEAELISVTVPPSAADTEQPAFDNAPLDSAPIQRMQQVYPASVLGSLQPGDQITGISFRLDSGQSDLPAQVITNYEIRLSRSVNEPGALSSTFADNRGVDEVIVRSGPLTINGGDFPGGGGPNPFGVIIPFTTPYTYYGGSLLLELSNDGFPSGGRLVDDSFAPEGQQLFGNGFASTTADLASEPGFIPVVLQIQRLSVPALDDWALMLLALVLAMAGFVAVRR